MEAIKDGFKFKDFDKFNDFIADVTAATSCEQIFQKVQKFIQQYIPHDAFLGVLVDEKERKIAFEYVVNVRENKIYEKHHLPLCDKDTLTGWVAANKKALCIGDTDDKKSLPANLRLIGEVMRSWLGVPILYNDEILGVISIQSVEPNKFVTEDIYFLELIANVISPVIKSKILEEKFKIAKQKDELIEHAISPIIAIQDEKLVFVNAQFENFFGLKKEEVLGKDFLTIIHPDEAPKIKEDYNKRMRGIYVPPEYIVKFVDKYGRTKWGLVRAKRMMWDGKWADVMSIADITELKRYADSLKELEKYLCKLREINDEEQLYDLAIDAIRRILQIDKAGIGILKGKNIEIIKSCGGDNHKFFLKEDIIEKVIKDAKSQSIKIDDETAYFVPISAEKKVYGFLCVVKKGEIKEKTLVDILANHLALSLHALQLRRRIEESRNIQKLMVQIIGHDLQNVLAVIKGYAELLKEEHNNEYIDEILKSVQRAEYIVHLTRIFSKLDIYRIKEKIETLDMREIIKRAFEHVREKFKNAKINIKGDAVIRGYILLENAFSNLLDNAFKYGATKVDVSIEENDDMVRIKIIDDGKGIPESERGVVFEEFKRLDTNVNGFGLGLWIVKKIVDMHNGKIWIEANKPKGSIFVIEIPKQ